MTDCTCEEQLGQCRQEVNALKAVNLKLEEKIRLAGHFVNHADSPILKGMILKRAREVLGMPLDKVKIKRKGITGDK